MKIVNEKVSELILTNMQERNENDKSKHVIAHLLSGGKQRSCVYENKPVNPKTILDIRNRVIPYIIFQRDAVVIKDDCPKWLKDSEEYKTANNYAKNFVQQPKVQNFDIKSKTVAIDFDGSLERKYEAMKERAVSEAITKTTLQVTQELKVKFDNDLKVEIEKQNSLLLQSYNEKIDALVLSHNLQLEGQKGKNEVTINNYKNLVKQANERITKLRTEYERAQSDSTKILSEKDKENTKLSTTIQLLETDKSSLLAEISALKTTIEEMTPKHTRAFYVQSFVSIAWLLGLVALSVFSVENMLIYFNAGSFWFIALILGIFIEFMLWATNITRFSGSLDDNDSLEQTYDLSIIIFVFRAFANALGGFYIAKNAVEYAAESGLYASFGTKFTDLKELYFGYDFGDNAIIFTSIIIGGFVAYMEYKALPLAIRHAYNLFIEKVK